MKAKNLCLLLGTVFSPLAMASSTATLSKKAQVPAQPPTQLPASCATLINYTIQVMNQNFAEMDSDSLTLKKDPATYPVTNVQVTDNCDEDNATPSPFCKVAGGSPTVYQADVNQISNQSGTPYKLATVTVTYNRGGCRIDQLNTN